jgi:hypothetical protein
MPAGAHGNAYATRAGELHRLDHVSIRRKRDNNDLWETIWNALLPTSDAESVRQAALIPQP